MTIARSSTWGGRLIALLVDPRSEVATRQLKNLFHLVVAVVVAVIAFGAVENGALILAPASKLGYFLKYANNGGRAGHWNVASWDQVFISPRPHDCEWETAPLGSKHCHYDPVVSPHYQ